MVFCQQVGFHFTAECILINKKIQDEFNYHTCSQKFNCKIHKKYNHIKIQKYKTLYMTGFKAVTRILFPGCFLSRYFLLPAFLLSVSAFFPFAANDPSNLTMGLGKHHKLPVGLGQLVLLANFLCNYSPGNASGGSRWFSICVE